MDEVRVLRYHPTVHGFCVVCGEVAPSPVEIYFGDCLKIQICAWHAYLLRKKLEPKKDENKKEN